VSLTTERGPPAGPRGKSRRPGASSAWRSRSASGGDERAPPARAARACRGLAAAQGPRGSVPRRRRFRRTQWCGGNAAPRRNLMVADSSAAWCSDGRPRSQRASSPSTPLSPPETPSPSTEPRGPCAAASLGTLAPLAQAALFRLLPLAERLLHALLAPGLLDCLGSCRRTRSVVRDTSSRSSSPRRRISPAGLPRGRWPREARSPAGPSLEDDLVLGRGVNPVVQLLARDHRSSGQTASVAAEGLPSHNLGTGTLNSAAPTTRVARVPRDSPC